MDLSQLNAAAAFVEEHRTAVIVAAGITMATLSALGWLVGRYLKGKADLFGRFCDSAAVVIAIALSGEGMWEVATEKMHFGPDKAILLFAFAELAMSRSARRARAKVAKGRSPGIYGVLVWSIALGAGVIASLNAPNAAELGVRLAAPALVAAQWWADLIEELREKRGHVEQPSTWIWTPRRIGIELGLIKPGAGDDLTEVFRLRNIEIMVRTARRMRAAGPRRARRLAAKLQRIGETLDEKSMLVVVERYQRGARVQQTIFGELLIATQNKPTQNKLTQSGDAPDAAVTQSGDARDDAPLTHGATHPVTHPDAPLTHRVDAPADAPADAVTHTASPAATQLTRRIDAGATRRGKTVLKVPADLDDADRDTRVRQAADAVEKGTDLSQREVARRHGITETSLRRELTRRKEARKPVNGHDFASAAQ